MDLLACSQTRQETGGSGGSSSSSTGGFTSTTTSSTGASTSTSVTSSTSTGTTQPLPDAFMVTGLVTDGTSPLAGAIVMQGGGEPAFETAADGKFTILITNEIAGTPALVAAKIGFRTKGIEILELPAGDLLLELRAADPPDNVGYVFEPPGVGDAMKDSSTAVCGHCHTTFVKQFRSSAHAKSAKDPLVQDLYAGVTAAAADVATCSQLGGAWRAGLVPGTAADSAMKCYAGGGVLPDLNVSCGKKGDLACDDPALPAAQKPASFGGCADCHAPGIDGKAGGRSLHDAVGTSFDAGNHCDVCHKARDVDLSKSPGVAGAIVLQRPHEKISDDPASKVVQVMFGPLPDVPNEFMGGSFQPKFKTSELCGGCHEQHQQALLPGASLDPGRWPEGLPTLDTYAEWSGSSFNTPGTPCQLCHMPPDDTGLSSTLDVTNEANASISFGFVRPPDQLRKHIFRGPLDGAPRFIDTAVGLSLATSLGMSAAGDPVVKAAVTVQNTLAGHAIPTGEPMRALVLVVRAEGCAQTWSAAEGGTIQDGGGAIARGEVGLDVQANGASLAWLNGAAFAKAGMRVRVVRPTGTFDDYAGIGFFADVSLTPEEKGMPLFAPVGEASVLSAAAGQVTLDAAIPAQPGDVVYLGDALPAALADGAPSLAIAGAAGYTFAKVMLDPAGARHVPHYRAVDIASDNRLPPQGKQKTSHAFAIPAGCASGKVTATLIYRPIPADMARLRGWDAKDWVVASTTQNVSVP